MRIILDKGIIQRDEAGCVVVINGVNIDLTETVQTGLPSLNGHEDAGGTTIGAKTAASNLLATLFEDHPEYQVAPEILPITIFEHDADLRYRLLLNSRLGYSDTFAVGKTDRDIMEPALAAALTDFKRKVLETGTPAREDFAAAAPGKPIEYFDVYAQPRRDAAGHVTGLICVATDITEKKRSEETLRVARDTFQLLVDRCPFGVYIINSDFRLVRVSDGAQNVFKTVQPLVGRDFAEVLGIIWSEPFATEAVGIFRHTLATGEPYHAPRTIEQRADINQTEAYDWKIERITLPDGTHGVVCYFYDLSERQQHEEHIRLIMQEINHRSKNLMGLIQSIARQTATPVHGDFVERFCKRVQSLAYAQDLLIKHGWQAVPLAALVSSQLSHFADLIGTRIVMSGTHLSLTAHAAECLGMAIHELATNAAKYGALSNDDGRIVITWAIDVEDRERPQFTIDWMEHGGPPVLPPEKTSFGTRVTIKAMNLSTDGKVAVDYAPTGLKWQFRCPANAVLGS